MFETFKNLLAYLKNPDSVKDSNVDFKYRLRIFFHFFCICIITSVLITPLFGLIEASGLIDMEQHKVTELFKEYSKGGIFLIAAVIAPILEELVFRAPLTLFKNVKSFSIYFYLFAIAFGLVHLSNYKISTNILLIAPILVLPQIILGGYLGCIRIKFGLAWSILLHACYNAFFISISFIGLPNS